MRRILIFYFKNKLYGVMSKEEATPKKEVPNYGRSGFLVSAEQLSHDGIILKYMEPPESAKPSSSACPFTWTLHVFKGEEQISMITLSEKASYRIGRHKSINTIVTEHESCSSQHAVIQFRQLLMNANSSDAQDNRNVEKKLVQEGVPNDAIVKPYIIDLGSTHGTKLNGKALPAERFVELLSKDCLQFAYSTREYLLLATPRTPQR